MPNKSFNYLRYKNVIWFDKFIRFYYWLHILFFCTLIWSGKKLLAFNFFLRIKEGLKNVNLLHPNSVFFSATLAVKPVIYLKPLRMAGKTYGVPTYMSQKKSIIFAIRLILKTLKDKYRVVRMNDIISVLDLASKNKGLAIEKKLEIYKTSLENKHLTFYLKS